MCDPCEIKTQFQFCYLCRELGYQHVAEVQNSESSAELSRPSDMPACFISDSCGQVPSGVGGT